MNASRTLSADSAHEPNPQKPTASSTFGLEFEFILVYPDSEQYPFHLVRRALSDPVSFRCRNPACHETHSYALSFHDNHQLEKNDYSRWSVTYDVSLFLDAQELAALPKGYTWSGIEIVTPIMTYNQSTDHTIQWQDELSAVLTMLHTNLIKKSSYPIVNHSTGVHLHIGNKEQGFALDAIRGLVATFTALERQFESIMPPDRISAYSGRLNRPRQKTAPVFIPGSDNAVGLSATHLTNVFIYQHEDDVTDKSRLAMNVPAWLLLISRAEDVDDLKLFYTNKGSMLNLDNAYSSRPESQHIEVRPHSGSIDYAEGSAWVNLIISLLDTCSRVSPDELSTYLIASWKDPKYTLIDLARYVGASQTTQDFYGNMLSPQYARQRYLAQMAKVSSHYPLRPFIRIVEIKRRPLIHRLSIDRRIRLKFLNGLYGQAPRDLLCHFLKTDQIDQSSAPLLLEESDEESGEESDEESSEGSNEKSNEESNEE